MSATSIGSTVAERVAHLGKGVADADDLDVVGMAHQAGKGVCQQLMIVNQQYADRRWSGSCHRSVLAKGP